MVSWPDRRFIDLVGIEHPIVQAPMAGAGGIDLAVAAIEAGALGSLPCGMLSPEQVEEEVAELRSRTARPFALNFFCPAIPEDKDERSWRVLAPLRSAAEQQGEFGFGPMWAGQAAPLGRSLPAAELTRRLAAAALAILRPDA